MTVVVIKPAGVGQENKWLLLLVIVILCTSSMVIMSAGSTQTVVNDSKGMLDSRHDLNPVEQGLYADLESAAEEIRWLLESGESTPSVKQLAEEFIPPFVSDAVSAERGGHVWHHRANLDSSVAIYLGSTNVPEASGSFLLKIERLQSPDTQQVETDERPPRFTIWYHPHAQSIVELDSAEQLQAEMLKQHQWLQVISHYNASVTRPGTD